MGNSDLVVVINSHAYVIKGTDYEYRHQAIQQALARFDEELEEIEKLRRDPKTGELYPDADPGYFPEEVEVIRVYML